MNKINFYFVFFIAITFNYQSNAQININETFESGFPTGWSQTGGVFANANLTYVCEGTKNLEDNMYGSSANDGTLTSMNYVGMSNGTDVTITYEWNARPYISNPVDYTVDVEYSTDNGSNWNLVSTYAVTATTPCTIYSQIIPAANIPLGSDFKFRMSNHWVSGDSYHYIDDLHITQACTPYGSFTENFDTTAENSIPYCWNSIVNSTDATARIEVVNNVANSEPNSLEFFNGNDLSANLLLVSPQLTDLPNDTQRIRFMASGGVDYGLLIGTMTDPTDATTFVPMTGIIITAGYNEYTVNFTSGTTNQYIAIRHGGGAVNQLIKIDDFSWEPIPTASIADNTIYNFKYYPNPIKNKLFLQAELNINNVKIFNNLGQILLETSPKTTSATIDISTIKQGIYYLKVQVDSATKTFKILKE